MGTFWPPSWCSWLPWTECSVEPCQPGLRTRQQQLSKASSYPPKEVILKTFCVNSTEPRVTAVHWPEGNGVEGSQIVKPMQQRRRQCRCHNLKSLIDTLLQKNCKESEEKVECKPCRPSSEVYTHAYQGEPLLSCVDLAETRNAAVAASATSSRFYAILGGALGTAAFLIIVFWCLRFFLLSPSAARRRARRSADGRGGGAAGSGASDSTDDRAFRRPANALPYPQFLNSELPPAYKDVVAMTTILPENTASGDEGSNQRLLPPLPPLPPVSTPPPSTPSASVPGDGAEGAAGNGDGEGVEEPPPPSYQEVIAFSPSAADMRLRVLAATVGREESTTQPTD